MTPSTLCFLSSLIAIKAKLRSACISCSSPHAFQVTSSFLTSTCVVFTLPPCVLSSSSEITAISLSPSWTLTENALVCSLLLYVGRVKLCDQGFVVPTMFSGKIFFRKLLRGLRRSGRHAVIMPTPTSKIDKMLRSMPPQRILVVVWKAFLISNSLAIDRLVPPNAHKKTILRPHFVRFGKVTCRR